MEGRYHKEKKSNEGNSTSEIYSKIQKIYSIYFWDHKIWYKTNFYSNEELVWLSK